MNLVSKAPKFFGRLGWIIILILVTVLYLYRSPLIDKLQTTGYQPTAELAKISTRTTMTSAAKTIFYASDPTIQDAKSFNQDCSDHESDSVTLGCYRHTDNCNQVLNALSQAACMKIKLFSINRAELDGIVDVTAAHEMLHAAYARLSEHERTKLNDQLQKQTTELIKDQAFKERLSVYDDLSHDQYVNELHSVLGTEVDNLSTDLKIHYRQYFQDRSQVVKLYQKYSNFFLNLKKEADQLADSLKQQADDINRRIAAHNQLSRQLSSDINSFNRLASSPGGFSSQASFLSARQQIMARVEAAKAEESAIQQAIVNFNKDNDRLKSIAGNLDGLNHSIDSNLTPVPAV